MAKIEVYNTICYFFVEFVITNGASCIIKNVDVEN